MQRKLAIGRTDDPAEREADRVADEAMRGPVRRLPRGDASGGAGVGEVPPIVQRVLSEPGRPLEPGTRVFMESRFGVDLADVRVHTDAVAMESARAIGARAYAAGTHVAIPEAHARRGAGCMNLLGHELAHVIQQSALSPPVVRRQPRGGGLGTTAAGGCGVCQEARFAGTAAHRWIGSAFVSGMVAGFTELRIFKAGVSGRLDLAMFDRRTRTVFLGEVKPGNQAGLSQGRKDQAWYRDLIRDDPDLGSFFARDLTPLQWNPGALPVGFLRTTGLPPSCGQLLYVEYQANGVYVYHCEPPASVQEARPDCQCKRRGRRRGKGKGKGKGRNRGKGGGKRPTRRPPRAPKPRVPRGAGSRAVGRAAWRRFWRVVARRLGARGAAAAGLALADGPLPIGDIIGLGLTIWMIYDLLEMWDEMWEEAQQETEADPEPEPDPEPELEIEPAPQPPEATPPQPRPAPRPPPPPPPAPITDPCDELRAQRDRVAEQIQAIEALEAVAGGSRGVAGRNEQRNELGAELDAIEAQLQTNCPPQRVAPPELIA